MITLTEVPTSVIQDNFVAIKSLATLGTSYCKRTNQNYLLIYDTLVGGFSIGETITGSISGATGTILTNSFSIITYTALSGIFVAGETITGSSTLSTANLTSAGKYDNPFVSVSAGSFFDNFNSKTENGALVGSFDLATGTFTAPVSGWYYLQMQIGWSLNGSNQYAFYSDNANTPNQYWVTGANDVGTFQITNYLVGSGLLSSSEAVRTQGTSSLYLYNNVLAKLSVGNQCRMVYTNNTDLEMFGGNNSAITFRGVRIGS